MPSKATDKNPETLSRQNPKSLIAALAHPTMLWRKQAQRLLVERGKRDVVPQLCALLNDKSVDEVGLNAGAVHALQTLAGLGVIADEGVFDTVVATLQHPSAGVRRNAAQVLPPSTASVTAILESKILNDRHPQVRLAALLALAGYAAGRTCWSSTGRRNAWNRERRPVGR